MVLLSDALEWVSVLQADTVQGKASSIVKPNPRLFQVSQAAALSAARAGARKKARSKA